MESQTTALLLTIRTPQGEICTGGTLAGALNWTLPVSNPRFAISCGWFVKGGPVFDLRCHAINYFRGAVRTGSHEFSFPLPEGPLPFRGELFEVAWIVEAFEEQSGQVAQVEIALLVPERH